MPCFAEYQVVEEGHVTAENLQDIFSAASVPRADLIYDFSYEEMICLSNLMTGWSTDKSMSPEQSANFLGMAQAFQDLADHMGPDWAPVKPERLSLLQFIAKRCLEGAE